MGSFKRFLDKKAYHFLNESITANSLHKNRLEIRSLSLFVVVVVAVYAIPNQL